MPDFSKYSPEQPFVPSEFSKVNLSDVFIPAPKMPDVNTLGTGSSTNVWNYYLKTTGRNPFAGRGVVPVGPAAASSYWGNQKFTENANDTDLYHKLGFQIGRDNDDLYGKAQGWGSQLWDGGIRLLDKAGAYFVEGMGFLGGLLGVDNNSEKYNSGSGFADWIAGAADNGLAVWGKQTAEDIDNIYRPIYQEAADRDKGFWKRMLTDGDFWTGDAVEGAAFLAGAYGTSGLGKMLGLGEKALRGTAALRGLGYADEAVALSEEGLTGMSKATSLSAGIEAGAEGGAKIADILPKASGTSTVGRMYNGVINEAGNFKNAERINKGVSTLLNTASESLFEASSLKDDMTDRLLAETNPDGSPKYTPEQVKNITAKLGRDSFGMNMAALFLSNLWEVNLFYGKTALSSSRNVGSSLIRQGKGLLDNSEMIKRTFGAKALDYLKHAYEGVAVEGLWEENIQLAIERANKDEDNIDRDFYSKIGKVLNRYGSQTVAALSGNDPEASMSIGLGGLMGGIMGSVERRKEIGQLKRDVSDYNEAVGAFRTTAKDLYKKDDQGGIVMENGVPVTDRKNVISFLSSLSKTLDMSDLGNQLKDNNLNILSSFVKNENFSKLVQAYAKSGMVDNLIQKLDGMDGFKPEDLLLLGLSPQVDKAELKNRLSYYKKTAETYRDIYNNIEKNFFVDVKNQNKATLMKSKLYFLSIRAAHLAELQGQVDSSKEVIKSEFTNAYDHVSDSLVDELNDLYAKRKAAKDHLDFLAFARTGKLPQDQGKLNGPGDEVRDLGDGTSLTIPANRTKDRRVSRTGQLGKPGINQVYSNDAVDEQDLADAHGTFTEADKKLLEFLQQNKDTLKDVKRGADGRFRYNSEKRNALPQSSTLAKTQSVAASLEMARNATLNVFNRISDIKYGERYYDEVYGRRKQGIINDVEQNDSEPDQPERTRPNFPSLPPSPTGGPQVGFDVLDKEEAYKTWSNIRDYSDYNQFEEQLTMAVNELHKMKPEDVTDEVLKDLYSRNKALRALGDFETVKKALREELTKGRSESQKAADKEEIRETEEEIEVLKQKTDRTPEEEKLFNDLQEKLDELTAHEEDQTNQEQATSTVGNSSNIKPEDKTKFIDILKKIAANAKKVVKFDTFYEIDGNRYRKLTELIGDEIPAEERALVQNAVNAGYTIDKIVKAFFGDGVTKEFKTSVADKISDDALAQVVKQLENIQKQLVAKGIDIVGSNVMVWDENQRIAGEIDLLGVDKNGNFKIYEIQARQNHVYKIYGKVGRGIRIREIDQQRLSSYRNLFANQYGAAPNEISVLFPFQVQYDKSSTLGFIEGSSLRKEIRFTPTPDVRIRRKVFEPVRAGSKFNAFDILRAFSKTFLTTDSAKAKLSFILRNVAMPDITSGITLTVKKAGQEFLDRYAEQTAALAGIGKYTPTKIKNFDNLYRLVGDMEVAIKYGNEVIGYMPPMSPLGYKGTDGKFHILSEATDAETYERVTGNLKETYPEFKRVVEAYKGLHDNLRSLLGDKEEVTLTNKELQELVGVKVSYGELDKIVGESRPALKDLIYPGVRVLNKSVPTVVHIDADGGMQVFMERNKKGKNVVKKFQDVDRWVNNNEEDVLKTITNSEGKRVTDYAAVIELPDGSYRVISLRKKNDVVIDTVSDFVDDLGNKFTAAVSKQVFKNENVSVLPQFKEEETNINLKGEGVIAGVYEGDDINELEKKGNGFMEMNAEKFREEFRTFLVNNPEYGTVEDLEEEFANSEWSSVEDFLDNLENCR